MLCFNKYYFLCIRDIIQSLVAGNTYKYRNTYNTIQILNIVLYQIVEKFFQI